MGSQSIAHEAELLYLLGGHEGETNNYFSKIQLVGQRNIKTKHLALVKARLPSFFINKTLQNNLIW